MGFLVFFALLGIFGCCNGFATKEQRKNPDYDPVADCDCLYCFLCPSRFCRDTFQIERAALHSHGPDPHSRAVLCCGFLTGYNKQERSWVARPQDVGAAAGVNYIPELPNQKKKKNSDSCCPADCNTSADGQDCELCCRCCCELCGDGSCFVCCHGCAECCAACNAGAGSASCDNCGGSGGDSAEALAVLLVIALILVMFFAFVGFLYGLVLGSALLQRVVQRHYHVLQRRLLAKDYVVLDLRTIDLSAWAQNRVAVVIDVPDDESKTATVSAAPVITPVMAPMAPVYDKIELQRLLGNA